MAKRKTPKVKDLKVKAEQLQENELNKFTRTSVRHRFYAS